MRSTWAAIAPSSVAHRRGRCEYAQADSVPSGERVGSATVICPSRMKGSRGIRPTDRSAATSTRPSSSTPRCTVPDPAGLATPSRERGVEGPVDLERRVVPLEAAQVVEQPGRRCARDTGRRRERGAGTSASTARAGPAPWCRRRAAPRRPGRTTPPPRSPAPRTAPARRATRPAVAGPSPASRHRPRAPGSRRPGPASPTATRTGRCPRCRGRRRCASRCR